MSSIQPCASSASLSPQSNRSRRKSRFTFRHLNQLSISSASCPLRIIAHLDLDAFYAQCEMVRLDVPKDKPLAVQQWQGLIAINYPARKYGLSRHVTITEAQAKCPEIILQHVATWKEGEEKWAYHDDAFKNLATHKVSLDPYRLQSRKILATIKNALPPPPLQTVEKASIDEVFLDLSAQVHSLLIERYPELQGPPPYDDPTENLPAPQKCTLDWNADALVDLDPGFAESEYPDWDDIAMLIGSQIVRSVRTKVRSELDFTCSAGISRNKMLAKLGSAHRKPNQQTVIRNRAVQKFLSDMKFTKIRLLGGKLGDEVVGLFNTDCVKDLLSVPVEQLKKKLGNDTGLWLYQTVRGEDCSEVNSRTQIKSMLSAKSFRPTIATFEQAIKWLRIFAADIFSRLVEEGVTANKRRPRTINLHHRQGGQTRSKQAPIPLGSTIDETLLLNLAKDLLAQVVVEGRAWPCSNLSLSVGGFEDGITGNRGIGGFLVRGEEAKAIQCEKPHKAEKHSDEVNESSSIKRRHGRLVSAGTISQYFGTGGNPDKEAGYELDMVEDIEQRSAKTDAVATSQRSDVVGEHARDREKPDNYIRSGISHSILAPSRSNKGGGRDVESGAVSLQSTTTDAFFCSRCQKNVLMDQQEEHDDWHFAKELQDQERPEHAVSNTVRQPQSRSSKSKRGRGRLVGSRASNNAPERGQTRLAFQ